MTLEALIFDVDGTLADTEETHRQAFNYAFVRYGLDWDWSRSLYRELLRISGGKERIAHFIAALAVSCADKARLLRLVPAIHSAKTELYTELIGDGRCTLRPGVMRLLTEARDAGLKLGIASTTTSANVNALLARHGAPCFHTMASGDLVPRKKPEPDIYDSVLATLGLSADRCVAFEDSANGVRAAKAARLFTVVTPSQWTVGEQFDGADLELPHLGDERCPLPPEQARTVGAPWLGLEQLRALHTAASGQVIALARAVS
jgi:HAD superfamily hydrolase (TIGR01509 family)